MSALFYSANEPSTKEAKNPATDAIEMIPTSADQENAYQVEVEERQRESKPVAAAAKAQDKPVSVTGADIESSVGDALVKGLERVGLADQQESTAAASLHNESPDGDFNRFPELPAEIRVKVIQAGFDDYEIEIYKLYFGLTGCKLNFGPLPLLLATRESRSVGLEYLDILGEHSGGVKLNSDGLSKAFCGIYTQYRVHLESQQSTFIEGALDLGKDLNLFAFEATFKRMLSWRNGTNIDDMPQFSVPYMTPSLVKLLNNLTSLVLNFTPFARSFVPVKGMRNSEKVYLWHDPAAYELALRFYPKLFEKMPNVRILELLVPEESASFGGEHVSYHDLMSKFDSNGHVIWETGFVPFKVKVAQIKAGIKAEIEAEIQAEFMKLSAEDPRFLRLKGPNKFTSGLRKMMQPQDTILKLRTNVQQRVGAEIKAKWWAKWTEVFSPDDLDIFAGKLQENVQKGWDEGANPYPTITLVTWPLRSSV